MKQLSKVLVAALISAGAITSASAVTRFSGEYGLGSQSYIGTYNGATFDSAFFNNGTEQPITNPLTAGSTFTNVWVFDFTPGGQVSVNASFNPSGSISNFTVRLYNASYTSTSGPTGCGGTALNPLNCTVAGTVTGFSLGSLIGTGAPQSQGSNLGFTPITAGKYAFVVTGQVNGAPALYSGQLSTTNIPEPSSLALVGLAMVGAGAVLRKRKAA